MVQLCFESMDLDPSKKLFMESIFPLGVFLTTCTDEQLLQIREQDSIEILVQTLASYEKVKTHKQGKSTLTLAFETLERLFDFDWKNNVHKMEHVGLSHIFQQFEEFDGIDFLNKLASDEDADIQRMA